MTFEDFIAPLSKDQFFNEYFEKKPLYIDKQINAYEKVLSLAEIESAIKNFIFTPAEFRIAKDGVIIPTSEYADINQKRKTEEHYINFAKALPLYADGATLVFESLHEKVKGLGDFCQELEILFQNNVQSNIYLTPPGSKGFARHFDTHEVFVLQIAGEKEWLIYDNPPIELPVRQQSHHPFKDHTYPVKHQFILKPGQGIYIPRGFMHEAKSNTDLSLHVTFGVVTYNYIDFIIDLLNESQINNPFLRKSLKVGSLKDGDGVNEIEKFLSQNIQSVGSAKNIRAILEKRKGMFYSSRSPRIENGISLFSQFPSITANTIFAKYQHLPIILTEQDNKVNLKAYNKVISFPVALKPYLDFILDAENFTLEQLGEGLTDASKKLLITKLLRESILSIKNI